jgi:tripartite-type tricarboxylate transporter receptor subunit TctC
LTLDTRSGFGIHTPLRFVARAVVVAVVFAVGATHAQDYPSRPVRIVTIEAGGGNDNIARLVAQGLTAALRQNVVVENRGGASGIIAGETVAKATPDGHTLLSMSGSMWTLHFMQKVPYDPVRDFAPVSLTVSSPNILVVNLALAAKSVRELIALAKAKPGELNYSSAGTGSGGHLAAELFKSMAGVNIVRVPYKGGGPAMIDLVAGRVQLSFTSAATAIAHLNSGKLRALGVTSAKPSALAPAVPTIASEGLPGYELVSTYGLFAPAKTPSAIIRRLHQEVVKALHTPELRERFFSAGTEIVASSPEAFAATIRSDQVKLGKLIREAKITSH